MVGLVLTLTAFIAGQHTDAQMGAHPHVNTHTHSRRRVTSVEAKCADAGSAFESSVGKQSDPSQEFTSCLFILAF